MNLLILIFKLKNSKKCSRLMTSLVAHKQLNENVAKLLTELSFVVGIQTILWFLQR